MLCPVCKANNDRGPQCRRCRADLSLLFTLEEQRQALLDQAFGCLREGTGISLISLVDQIEQIRFDEECLRLRALGYLLQRQYSLAWQTYQCLPHSRSSQRNNYEPCLTS